MIVVVGQRQDTDTEYLAEVRCDHTLAMLPASELCVIHSLRTTIGIQTAAYEGALALPSGLPNVARARRRDQNHGPLTTPKAFRSRPP